MWEPPPSPYLVPFDGSFRVDKAPTANPDRPAKSECLAQLAEVVAELSRLQRILYAHDSHGILLVFQAMDAAGKDSTIRAVTSGINSAGFQVHSFKQPSSEELDHDFLWRTSRRLPERGRIGIFNRSYYEEVLIVRVHPNYLGPQRLPTRPPGDKLWEERFESIRQHEQHLARSGMVIVKFWLNVSKEKQRRRLLRRINVPEKNWKYSPEDIAERQHWDSYMHAYGEALNATSRPWAPWYAIPADNKPFMQLAVAKLLLETLQGLDLHYPALNGEQRARIGEMRKLLERDE